jgi:hypothetical protein
MKKFMAAVFLLLSAVVLVTSGLQASMARTPDLCENLCSAEQPSITVYYCGSWSLDWGSMPGTPCSLYVGGPEMTCGYWWCHY